MRTAAPVHTARLLGVGGAADIPLPLRDDSGSITLDSSRWPHVSASLTVAVENTMLLADLDPRNNRRIRIDTYPTPNSAPRAFDLGIRSVSYDDAAAVVEVSAASDEALLDEYAQLTDDDLRALNTTSLRDVCNYVLGKIGADLKPGLEDASLQVYSVQKNLVLNPWPTSATGWSKTGDPLTQFSTDSFGVLVRRVYGVTSNYGFQYAPQPVTAGETYTARCDAAADYPNGEFVEFVLRWLNTSGATISESIAPQSLTAQPNYKPVAVTGVAPVGAVKVAMIMRTTFPGVPPVDNGYLQGKRFKLSAGVHEPEDYFDGDTFDDTYYTYDWDGARNASTSTRTPLKTYEELLIWPAGTSGLALLSPMLQAAGFRLVCNERREWTLRAAEYREPGAQAFDYGDNLISASEQLARDAEEWFDAAVYVYEWTDLAGVKQTRTDAYSLTPTPTKIVRRKIDSPFPGPGRAEYAVTRAQGKGRTVTVTRQATWDEASEQQFSALLRGDLLQMGVAERVTFDLARNEVTTLARTTDAPAIALRTAPSAE